jgi:nanoRNase/pAp phosphatase (c-di-AMP/oligoRNAs hydrolase)
MDNVILEKIKELLAKNENIGIAVGKNPGIDEMAAALSLYLALSEVSKKVTVVCPTETIVEVSSLVGIDKVKRSFEGGVSGDLTVTFPYKEGEIEKISYTLEESKLNILVKAGENGLSFSEKDVEFKRGGQAPGLVFVVGTPRISDLGTAFDMEVLKDSKIINIDYKSENQGFGDIPLLGKSASSVSELMSNFISSLGLKIDVDIASNLLSGIMDATNNFQSSQTSSLAFETAAFLLKKGAVRQTKEQKKDVIEDSFFTPISNASPIKQQEDSSTFPKMTIGTEERKPEIKLDEDNPPDDWLSPKIYKGSTSV